MIYTLAKDLADTLGERLFPVTCLYGPERVSREGPFANLVVFRRDPKGGDRVSSLVAQRTNPRAVRVREIGVEATIFAASTLDGARINEHEHECDQLVDALIVALYEWGAENRAGAISFTETRYLDPTEPDGVFEAWPGVRYVLRFAVPRAVLTTNYVGAARPEVALAGVTSSVRVSLDGTNYETVIP